MAGVRAGAHASDLGDANAEEGNYDRIELVWPGKDLSGRPRQSADGRWRIEPAEGTVRIHSLVDFVEVANGGDGGAALVVTGDRLDALAVLAHHYIGRVSFAYVDVPRIEIDDQESAFHGDPTYAYSTWLSVLRAHVRAVIPLLRRDGVLAVLAGDVEEPFARLVLAEELGRGNYVGTVVWQRSYGPRNMKGMQEFTATHDCICLTVVDKSAAGAIGLRLDVASAGFENRDDDPRGSWKAAHKGARTRRENSDFNTYVPPYRWQVVDGELPPGIWRVNPLTGVIWGVPEEVGEFSLVVEVSDSSDNSTTAALKISVLEEGRAPALADVEWAFQQLATAGELRVVTSELPDGVKGAEYSAVVLAAGGEPFASSPKRPGSGRYWEFAQDTLRAAYARDMVDLGTDGNVIPRIKSYAREAGEEVVQNQQTWWPAKTRDGQTFAGFTQDATKHLKKLQELGLVQEITTASKPDHLLRRLVEVFTKRRETVLEVFGGTADLASVALKTERDVVYLSGGSARETLLLERCAVGRLTAVVQGSDNGLENIEGEIQLGADQYIPWPGGGTVTKCSVGDWTFEQRKGEDLPMINRRYLPANEFPRAILTSQGFVPADAYGTFTIGHSLDGSAGIVVSPDSFLTSDLSAEIVSRFPSTRVTVYFFIASDDFDPTLAPSNVTYRRVPTDVPLRQ